MLTLKQNLTLCAVIQTVSRLLPTLHPLIVGGLIKKRGLAIFPEEINGEGANKWKWVNFVMQCLNRGLSIVGVVTLIFLTYAEKIL